MPIIDQRTLGDRAQGTFGQGANPDQSSIKIVNSGMLMRPVSQILPGICGDERCDAHGNRPLVPAAFGGFGSLVLADALTMRRWYRPGITFEAHMALMFGELRKQCLPSTPTLVPSGLPGKLCPTKRWNAAARRSPRHAR